MVMQHLPPGGWQGGGRSVRVTQNISTHTDANAVINTADKMGVEVVDGPCKHNVALDVEPSSSQADFGCLDAVQRRGTSCSSSFEMFIAGVLAFSHDIRALERFFVPHASRRGF